MLMEQRFQIVQTYRDIAIHAHDIITVVYGQAPSSIPNKADFTEVDPQQIQPK